MTDLAKAYDLYEAVLTDLSGVICIIDTNKPQSGDKHALGHAAILKGDKIVGWHVTDSAKAIRQIVRKGGSLMRGYGARGQTAELGPGLYVSAVPHTWVSRSRGKWDFLKDISKADLKKLVDVLGQRIDKARQDKFISQSEYDYAMRDLKNVKAGSYDADMLIQFAGQPFNIRFWKESFLKPLGISTVKQPIEVEVHLKGKFAGIEGSHAPPKTLRMLRRGGIDGAFIKGGFVGDAQLVVWNPKAIVKIGKEQRMTENYKLNEAMNVLRKYSEEELDGFSVGTVLVSKRGKYEYIAFKVRNNKARWDVYIEDKKSLARSLARILGGSRGEDRGRGTTEGNASRYLLNTINKKWSLIRRGFGESVETTGGKENKISESKSRVNVIHEIADEVLGRESEDIELDEGRKKGSLSVPEKQRKRIALLTLKISKAGALVAGGMDHKGAVKFLISIGYSRKKIEALLRGHSHSDKDIKGFFSESSLEDVEIGLGSVRELRDNLFGLDTVREKDKIENIDLNEKTTSIKNAKDLFLSAKGTKENDTFSAHAWTWIDANVVIVVEIHPRTGSDVGPPRYLPAGGYRKQGQNWTPARIESAGKRSARPVEFSRTCYRDAKGFEARRVKKTK